MAPWRESLLAQAVLAGRTRSYRQHPQLVRFLESSDPQRCIAAYLRGVHEEAVCRDYRFDERKIGPEGTVEPLTVTRGQLDYEWEHLVNKLGARSPAWLDHPGGITEPESHPLFHVAAGGVAEWEIAFSWPVSDQGQDGL